MQCNMIQGFPLTEELNAPAFQPLAYFSQPPTRKQALSTHRLNRFPSQTQKSQTEPCMGSWTLTDSRVVIVGKPTGRTEVSFALRHRLRSRHLHGCFFRVGAS